VYDTRERRPTLFVERLHRWNAAARDPTGHPHEETVERPGSARNGRPTGGERPEAERSTSAKEAGQGDDVPGRGEPIGPGDVVEVPLRRALTFATATVIHHPTTIDDKPPAAQTRLILEAASNSGPRARL